MDTNELTHSNYYHRELSWLFFNRRVIREASDESNPLLEQLRFLAIASSNLDEFFMIRVPGVQSLARVQPHVKDSRTNWTHEEVLLKLFEINTNNTQLQYQLYHKNIEKLATLGYGIQEIAQLSTSERQEVYTFFNEFLRPSITPIGLDAYHAFPKILEKQVHIFIKVKQGDRVEQAIIPLPPLFSRVHQLESKNKFIFLEQMIEAHLSEIFVGWEVEQTFFFRVTYDRDLEFQEEDGENLVTQMEEYVVERTKGLASRLEISGEWSEEIETSALYLAEMLELKARDLYWVPGPLDLTFLFGFVGSLESKLPEQAYPPFKGKSNAELKDQALYEAIEKNDLLYQHPFDSFEVVLNFLESAAEDPNTIAIKQTLYRMAPHSRVIAALKKAAENGKQVTVLVELKARFDEENNLYWVQELEEAGCYVSYGLQQLKTHSKALLIVKKENNQIKQYVHLGTGNYNEKTANLYTDISLFSAKKEFVEDVTSFFNYLSGYRSVPEYQKISVSPNNIRHMLIDNIEKVMQHYAKKQEGSIYFKMNSLTDTVVIDKLYEASKLGVPIHLIVRGACCLRPKVPNLSETITVTSIVGRFLEHSRIYAFYYGEKETPQVWISSADIMTRNMVNRVEIATPIEPVLALNHILQILETFKKDTKKAYFLEADGHYHRLKQDNDFSSQEFFMDVQPKLVVPTEEKPKDNLLAKLRKFWQTNN